MRTPTSRALAATLLVGAPLLLGGCVAEINAGDDAYHGGAYSRIRTATDMCRREVERSYEDRYRIAYDLPDLTSQGTTQTVVQPFTLEARRNAPDAPGRRTVRCTVVDGTLTQVGEGK